MNFTYMKTGNVFKTSQKGVSHMKTTHHLKLVLTIFVLLTLTVQGRAFDPASQGPMDNVHLLASQYVKFQKKQNDAVQKALEGHALHEALQAKIKEQINPGLMIKAFLKEIDRWRAEGMNESNIAERLDQLSKGRMKTTAGGIAGYVTVNGNPRDVLVLVFDEFGLYAASGYSSYWDGFYSFWLPDGKYYVMTYSQIYVDEFYDNVPALLGSFENWRQATLFDLTGGDSFEDINFDLQDGAHISGFITDSGGDTLDYEDLIFTLTTLGSPDPIFSYEGFSSWLGDYVFSYPQTGSYKFHIEIDGEGGTWYDNKDSWEEADPLVISALGDTMRGYDFTIKSGSEGGEFGGSVRKGDGTGSTDFALVVAFDMADTSLAGLGITIFGSYGIEGLPDGDYLLYADDFIGNLFGYGNWMGEYYEDAHTPNEATLVTLSEGNRKVRVDFTLDSGGSISGTVTGPDMAPVDSILILAITADIFNFDPFFSNVVLTVGLTDANGQYTISGLPSGDYILRTFTPGEYELDLWFWYFYVPGTHYGKVIDEYYDGIQDVFNFGGATRVPVTAPNTTGGIDFTLEAAGAVSGVVQEASEGYAIEDVYIFAFDPVTQYPQLAYGVSDWRDGSYVLSPLPQGEFVIAAIFLVESEWVENPFLSEFYDGAQQFEDATPVSVQPTDTTKSIDFTIEEGSIISGHVYLDEGFPAGADSLWWFPVVAYDAVTGEMVNLAWATFNGGYQIPKIPAGSYKICALPGFYGYAATYYGGGATFDDVNSTSIELAVADTFQADITVASAGGSIAGHVHNLRTGDPLTSSAVIAYDHTGHAAGFGFAGYDWMTEQTLDNNGAFEIKGLRAGSYHVRTWSIVSLLLQYRYLFDDWELDLDNLDPFELLDIVLGVDLGTEAYGDLWYQDVYIPFTEYDLINIVMNGLLYGIVSQYDPVPFTFYAPFPFYQELQGQQIEVTASDQTTGINFGLSILEPEEILDVTLDGNSGVNVPEDFVLHQNYPNPFNPETEISFGLPEPSMVTLTVYNVLGQVVDVLVDSHLDTGNYSVRWNGQNMASGIYFYQFRSNNFSTTKRMLLMK